MGEQACLWTSFKLKFIVNYWAEVDIRDQPGGPSGTAGDLIKILKFRRLSSLQQLTLDFYSNMDWEEYIYLFQVIIESSPSVLRLSLIENPLFFRGDLHATKARAQQLAERVIRFERVDFGYDCFVRPFYTRGINTMLKGITAASLSEAGSKLQVLSLPGYQSSFIGPVLTAARRRLTINFLGKRPRRIILHDDDDGGSDDEDGDEVN